MLLQILAHTPKWVFGLFALLFWLGARQLRSGRVGLVRVTVLALAMSALSVWGVISAFGDSPLALLCWAAAAGALGTFVLARPLPASTRYEAATRSFQVAGSAVPLALMMGIFFTKYVVGVLLAMHPQMAHEGAFAIAIGTIYGAFTGIFAARSLRLWKLALRGEVTRVGAAIPE